MYVAKLKLAQGELEKAKQAGIRTAELFDDLGSVAERLEEWDKALDAYEQSLKLEPPLDLTVKVRTKRGWIYAQSLKSPRYDKAAADFTAALRLDFKHADAHAGLGYVQALQGLPAEAHRSATLARRTRLNTLPTTTCSCTMWPASTLRCLRSISSGRNSSRIWRWTCFDVPMNCAGAGKRAITRSGTFGGRSGC